MCLCLETARRFIESAHEAGRVLAMMAPIGPQSVGMSRNRGTLRVWGHMRTTREQGIFFSLRVLEKVPPVDG